MAHQFSIKQLLDLQHSNFEVCDIQVFKDKIVWKIDHKEKAQYECSRCGASHNAAYDFKWIKLRDVPFGNKKCYWHIKRARVLCPCSMNAVVEALRFRNPNHKLTQRFVEYLEEVLCSKMFTVADVARLFDLDYSTIYKIDHEVLYRLAQHMEIPDPINIAVDEKSFKKGHSYVTIVTDVDLRKVIWVSQGNSKQSLDQFFQILGPERCAKIKTVSKDLHRPYQLSVEEFIPQALEIADKFHVVQRLNQAIDECRKQLALESPLSVRRRKTINDMHWILRFKKENLKQRQLEDLVTLEKLNQPLFKAYLLKESFYEFFNLRPSQFKEAKTFLVSWIVEAFKIGLKGLTQFASYLNNNSKLLINIFIKFASVMKFTE